MANKIMFIPNNNTKKLLFSRLQLFVDTMDTLLNNDPTNQN